MIEPYHAFLALTVILWALSVPRDRNALSVVVIASLFSEFIVDKITHGITGAWKLMIPGAVEILTILALLKWARNRTGYLQAALLSIAWATHVFCCLDVYLETDIVYSRYEAILYAVSAGQLATCYDTMLFNLGRIRNLGMDFIAFCSNRFPSTGTHAAVSGNRSGKNLSATQKAQAAV